MMRDGYIFQKLFERMYPDYESQSIYGSRTMFLLPGMESYDDIRLHITGIHRQGLTPRRSYERLAIDDESLWQAFEETFPDLDRPLHDEEDFAEVDAFFEAHEKELRAIGQEQRAVLIDYFESIGLFDGPCAIVDVGWKGSMLQGEIVEGEASEQERCGRSVVDIAVLKFIGYSLCHLLPYAEDEHRAQLRDIVGQHSERILPSHAEARLEDQTLRGIFVFRDGHQRGRPIDDDLHLPRLLKHLVLHACRVEVLREREPRFEWMFHQRQHRHRQSGVP